MAQFSDLRRSTTDSHLAGVCGGVAKNWGVDPTIVRVITAVLALSSGIGLFAYLAAWLLIPREGHDLPLVQEKSAWARKTSLTTLWIIAAVIGVACFFAIGSAFPLGIWPVGVIALVWYFGFHRPGKQRSQQPPQPIAPTTEATAFDRAAQAWAQRVAEHRSSAAPPATAPVAWEQPGRPVEGGPGEAATFPGEPLSSETTSPAQQPPADAFLTDPSRRETSGLEPVGREVGFQPFTTATTEPVAPLPPLGSRPGNDPYRDEAVASQVHAGTLVRERRPSRTPWLIATIAVGLGLGTLGVMSLAGVAVPPPAYVGVTALALGVSLIVSSFVARSTGLAVLAVVVTLASTATAASAAVGSFTVGDTTHRITTASELPANSDVRMGSLTLDLTELTLTEDTTITASVGMGELIIELPTDVDAEVQWQVGLGEATVPGDTFNGPNLGGTYRQDRQSTARLTIVADVGMGEVTVR